MTHAIVFSSEFEASSTCLWWKFLLPQHPSEAVGESNAAIWPQSSLSSPLDTYLPQQTP